MTIDELRTAFHALPGDSAAGRELLLFQAKKRINNCLAKLAQNDEGLPRLIYGRIGEERKSAAEVFRGLQRLSQEQRTAEREPAEGWQGERPNENSRPLAFLSERQYEENLLQHGIIRWE